MIVVQELRTRWTKLSRGAPAASSRNRTPRGLRLPVQHVQAQDSFFHRVVFAEEAAFEPQVKEAAFFANAKREIAGVEIRPDASPLVVSFVWSVFACGAPARPHGKRASLESGEWCQILHNGRFGYDHEWTYQSTVVNIAVLTNWNPDAFLSSPPTFTMDHRAELL